MTVNELGGAALRLWQGVGLTAWFLIEGPYSRTDLPGMRDYDRNEIQALSEVGTPADDGIFADLAATEGGRSNPTFAQMRDIITPDRRVWMERFLDIDLRNAWEGTLRKTAVAYHRHIAEKSKAPTAKRFASIAGGDANRWFGGSLAGVAGALGVAAPPAPTRCPRVMPKDPEQFAIRLFERLNGAPYTLPPSWKEDARVRERHNGMSSLCQACVHYIEIQEATGEPPTLAAYSRKKFQHHSATLADDIDVAWEIYQQAIQDTLDATDERRQSA